METKHSHKFANEFKGFVGFGLNRKSNEDTVTYYLQRFSNDKLMEVIKTRLTDSELEEIFVSISDLLKKHLTECEYHQLFLE